MTSSLTIGGVPCRMTQPLRFALYEGVGAKPFTFPMVPEDAAKILASSGQSSASTAPPPNAGRISTRERGGDFPTNGTELELILKNEAGVELRVKRLVCVGEAPAQTPFERVVVISDRRWFWRHNHITRSYNIPRNSLETRLVAPTGTPLAIQAPTADVVFAGFSLKDGRTPWTALEVLEDCLNEVAGQKGRDWRIDAAVKFEAPVQDLELDDPAPAALARVLALVPGVNLYMDLNGVVVVGSKLPGAADTMIKALNIGDSRGDERLVVGLANGGVLRKLDLALDRPGAVEVLYTREVGVRFDNKDDDDTSTSSTVDLDDEDAWMRNVARTTDPLTTVNGTSLAAGSWSPLVDLLAAWNTTLGARANLAATLLKFPLNLTNVRKQYLTNLLNLFTKGGAGGSIPDPVGSRYVSEIYNCLHLAYQLNPRYANAALDIIAKVVGIVDAETGIEGGAMVFTDHAVKCDFYTNAKQPGAGHASKQLIYNVRGAIEPYWLGGRISSAQRSPVQVGIESKQGIVRFSFVEDPVGFEQQTIPGACEDARLATGDYRNSDKTVVSLTPLEKQHKATLILTLIPGSPNSDLRYYRIRVAPSEVGKFFDPGSCRGPITEKRVGQALTTAKFPYQDNDKHVTAIKEVFGLREGPGNLGDPVNLSDLKELAVAMAARQLYPAIDRWSGTVSNPLRIDIVPAGEIQDVTFLLTPDGGTFTVVTCAIDRADDFDPFALLSASARRTLLRAVNPTGA